jgi:hypothetical protein
MCQWAAIRYNIGIVTVLRLRNRIGMWTVLLVSLGLVPIEFLALALYGSALIGRPMYEREQRGSIFADDASDPTSTQRSLVMGNRRNRVVSRSL